MNVWELPTSLEVNGHSYPIRADFRAILDILSIFSNPLYTPQESWECALIIAFPDYEEIPKEDLEGCMEQLSLFIDGGVERVDAKGKPSLMNWNQDAPIVIPAVNRVLGQEVRAQEFVHWWTFLGAYMEIGECLFSNVLSIRNKKLKGKPLEKYEQEYYRENKDTIDIKQPETEEEKAERKRLNALLG